MFLREYLYVDIDKVRGILSQIEEGVPESATQVERKEKDAELRNKILGGFGRRAVDEESIEKGLGDSLFKILEEELEALGILSDISDELSTIEGVARVYAQLRPGSVVRITAPARLFHPGQLSHALIGIGTAATGISELLASIEEATPAQPGSSRGRQQAGKARNRASAKPVGPLTGAPEDAILYFPEKIPYLGHSREFLSGMIKFVRGIFSEGVHLHLQPLWGRWASNYGSARKRKTLSRFDAGSLVL